MKLYLKFFAVIANIFYLGLFSFFTFHRKFLFSCLKPDSLPIYDNYNGIDIFFYDKQSNNDIIYCHGSKISGKVFNLLLKDMSLHTNCNVISFNIRGMFNNRGVSSEKGIRKEIDCFLECYKKKRNKKVIVFGQSLGCCLAIQIGRRFPVEKVILENPFINYKSLIKSKFKFEILSHFVVDIWDNSKISELNTVLFLLSEKDKLIPNDDGKTLQKLVKKSKVIILKGSDHFKANKNKMYYKHIVEFINS